jgi:putative CocE/NonD family hydrolase
MPTASDPTPADILPAGPISPKTGVPTAIVHGLLAPMRDGTLLAMDLIRPDAPGAYPVVLVRTPYDKTLARTPFLRSLADRGYVVAIQDTRGRFNSDGVFFPYRDDRADGYDTVEWVAAQAWCDGNVGMAGGSYVGQTQWFAAADAPPHLKAIVPTVSPPDAFVNEPICNGCFLLPMGEWMVNMGRRSWQTPPPFEWFDEKPPYFDALPVASLPTRANFTSPWWDEMMRHPNLDELWRACSYQDAWPRIAVPALNITGWWDMNFPGAPLNFVGMRQHGQTASIRQAQQLIIGPWPHRVNLTRELNGIDFGDKAVVNLDDYTVRFYDRWLKGVENGLETDPRVHVFVIGASEWWTADDWPLPEAEPTPFYFHSRGRANSLKGDGVLSTAQPGAEPADAYAYDPADPIGLFWNLKDGPVDDRIPSIRDDMLCYTSEPLAESLDVVGPVSCVLYASSSARDTDWHVRLVDVHPDGAARFLCHGMLRARFRESFEAPTLLDPETVYRFAFEMDACGVRFLPGHRIRVEVMSSWFPEYDRNTNSGAENNFQDDQLVVAHNRVYHETGRTSHIVLPIVHAR